MRLPSPRAALAALLALAAPAATPAGAPPRAHPALWKIEDADTRIYLFGTIHALPEGYQWEDATLRSAIASADRLVIEAVIKRDDPADLAATFWRLAVGTGLPPLKDRVPARYHRRLETMIAASRYPRDALDRMKTWAAALVLTGVTIGKLGVSTAAGVEEQLKARFAGKPVEGLETGAGQLGLFDSLPEAEQREFLRSVIDEPDDGPGDFRQMLAAWARGDERAIARSFDKDFKVSPTLRAVLLGRRNAAWAQTLKARLDSTPGTIFVAVGAGHLAGKGSVQEELAKQGIRVARVE